MYDYIQDILATSLCIRRLTPTYIFLSDGLYIWGLRRHRMGIRTAVVAGVKGVHNSLTLPVSSSAMHGLDPHRLLRPDPCLKDVRRESTEGGNWKNSYSKTHRETNLFGSCLKTYPGAGGQALSLFRTQTIGPPWSSPADSKACTTPMKNKNRQPKSQ